MSSSEDAQRLGGHRAVLVEAARELDASVREPQQRVI